jgi:hypothetical protein
MYCRLVNNTAVDVVVAYKNRFHVSLHSEFVECPDNVEAGWTYDADTDTWAAPVIPEPDPEPAAEETPPATE